MKRLKKGLIFLLVPLIFISSAFNDKNKVEALATEATATAWITKAIIGALAGGAIIKTLSTDLNPAVALKETVHTASKFSKKYIDPFIQKQIVDGLEKIKLTKDNLVYTKEKLKETMNFSDAMFFYKLTPENKKLALKNINESHNISLYYDSNFERFESFYTDEVGFSHLRYIYNNNIEYELPVELTYFLNGLFTHEKNEVIKREVKLFHDTNVLSFDTVLITKAVEFYDAEVYDDNALLFNFEFEKYGYYPGFYKMDGFKDVSNLEKNNDFEAFGFFIKVKEIPEKIEVKLNSSPELLDFFDLSSLVKVVDDNLVFVALPVINLKNGTSTKDNGHFINEVNLISKKMANTMTYFNEQLLLNSYNGVLENIDTTIENFNDTTIDKPNNDEIEKALEKAISIGTTSAITSLDFVNDLNNADGGDDDLVFVPPLESSINWPELKMTKEPTGEFGRGWFSWLAAPILWIGNLIKTGITSIFDLTKNIFNKLVEVISVPLNAIKDFVIEFPETFKNKLVEVIENIKSLSKSIAIPLEKIKDLVLDLPNILVDVLADVISAILSLPKTIAQAIIDAFSFLSDLASIITNAIVDALKWLFGIDEALILKELNLIKSLLMEKFFIFTQLKNIISSAFFNIDTLPPEFLFTLPTLFGGGTYNLIDVSVIMPFMSLWRGLIAGLVWISFIMSLFRKFRVD